MPMVPDWRNHEASAAWGQKALLKREALGREVTLQGDGRFDDVFLGHAEDKLASVADPRLQRLIASVVRGEENPSAGTLGPTWHDWGAWPGQKYVMASSDWLDRGMTVEWDRDGLYQTVAVDPELHTVRVTTLHRGTRDPGQESHRQTIDAQYDPITFAVKLDTVHETMQVRRLEGQRYVPRSRRFL